MKTLFVSDLDKTLLRDDRTLSRFTADALNALSDKGMIFTYATARSALTAKRVTEGLFGAGYAVVYNGAFTVDIKTGAAVSSAAFKGEESREILDLVLSFGVSPRVFSLIDGEERFTYTEKHLESEGAQEYFRSRGNDPRKRLATERELYEGEIFLISCVSKREVLLPLYEALSDRFLCHFYLDDYSEDWYLEILPKGATKAEAVLRLKEALGCERLVVFGDGVNDFSMFSVADEAYAVANACPELCAVATGIIGSNEEDGVARYLLSRYESGEEF